MALRRGKKPALPKRPPGRSEKSRPASARASAKSPTVRPLPPPRPARTTGGHPPEVAAAATLAPSRELDERRHVLSLSFVRDGDEFMARLETDGGQITELKNRSLDQLLTLVASELEDLLE